MDERAIKIVLVAVMTVLLLLTVLFNYLSTSAAGRQSGMFENKANSDKPWSQRGNITDSGLTPPGWAFSIWAMIYGYQAAMLGYSWSTLFRRGPSGEFICCSGLLPTSALCLHSASSLCNIAWTFLADRVNSVNVLLVPQTMAIFLMAVCLCAAAGLQFAGIRCERRLRRELLQLRDEKRQQRVCCHDIPLASALVLNANGFYAGWTVVASFLNLDIAVINLSQWPTASSGMLAIGHLLLVLAVYSTLDLALLRILELNSPYVSAIWALATSAGNNFGATSAATVLSIEMAVALAGVLVAKVVMIAMCVLQHRVEPQDAPAAAEEQQKEREKE